jgi:hypothetical protein
MRRAGRSPRRRTAGSVGRSRRSRRPWDGRCHHHAISESHRWWRAAPRLAGPCRGRYWRGGPDEMMSRAKVTLWRCETVRYVRTTAWASRNSPHAWCCRCDDVCYGVGGILYVTPCASRLVVYSREVCPLLHRQCGAGNALNAQLGADGAAATLVAGSGDVPDAAIYSCRAFR